MLEYQNTENIFAIVYTPDWSEEVLVIKEYKILFHRHMLLMISMVKKLLKHFIKKNYKKQINKDFEYRKPLKEKEINYMSNGKNMIIHLIGGLIKWSSIRISQYFPKLYEPFGGDIKVDLSTYATKADIKNNSHVDISSLELKSHLATLKTEVDKLDIDLLLLI